MLEFAKETKEHIYLLEGSTNAKEMPEEQLGKLEQLHVRNIDKIKVACIIDNRLKPLRGKAGLRWRSIRIRSGISWKDTI